MCINVRVKITRQSKIKMHSENSDRDSYSDADDDYDVANRAKLKGRKVFTEDLCHEDGPSQGCGVGLSRARTLWCGVVHSLWGGANDWLNLSGLHGVRGDGCDCQRLGRRARGMTGLTLPVFVARGVGDTNSSSASAARG